MMMGRVEVVLCVAILVSTGGCSRPVTQAQASDPTTVRMTTVAGLYAKYVASSKGELPSDEARLKEFTKSSEGKAYLTQQGVTADGLFASPSDDQALVLIYKANAPTSSASTNQIVAYEKNGRNGKRRVALLSGTVVEVDQAAFDKLQASIGKGH